MVVCQPRRLGCADDEQRRYQAKRMAVYAAMVEAMDFHLGRLVAYLKAQGQYDNTIFIFTSDNGAEASGPADPMAFIAQARAGRVGLPHGLRAPGPQGQLQYHQPELRQRRSQPPGVLQVLLGEGGMRVPLIVAGETVPRQGRPDPCVFLRDRYNADHPVLRWRAAPASATAGGR